MGSAMINLASYPRLREAPVPCKLNNAKTNKNTLDNYNGLFKIS